MPVRGTTKWTHAKADRVVINHDHMEGKHIYCAWDTCEKDGYESNKVVETISAPGHPLQTLSFVFCSERHKQYFIHSKIKANDLPPGYKRGIILGVRNLAPRCSKRQAGKTARASVLFPCWPHLRGNTDWGPLSLSGRKCLGICTPWGPHLGIRSYYGYSVATPPISPGRV